MKRQFRLTRQAKADLREILIGIAADAPDTAERILFEIEQTFGRLAKTPGIGHFREDLLDRRYRFWTFYSYVICYVWEARPIQVIAVIHGARELAAFFGTRSGEE